MRELSPLAILLGILIGVVFGMTATYVGLELGLTISAAIPATVLSVLGLRSVLKRGTMLECNITQTVASAGEALATGVIFIVPALIMLGVTVGYLDLLAWAGMGGLLGVLFMIPLRRMLIVRDPNQLPYPEGDACARVLNTTDAANGTLRTVLTGLGVGAGFSILQGLGFWRPKARFDLPALNTSAEMTTSPALLGLGYLLGPRIASYMFGGAVLGWFVLIPIIGAYGAGMDRPVPPETTVLVRDMSAETIWQNYVRYIGAGAIVFGAILSMLRLLPTVGAAYWDALTGIVRRRGEIKTRTQRDLPFPIIVLLIAAVGYAMFNLPVMALGTAAIVCALVFGLLLVAVSARLAGRMGNSFNPVSGMAIVAIVGTALVLVWGVKTGGVDAKAAAVLAGAVVCVAICVAGDTAQSLKTGHLVGATPYKQQIAKMIGVLTACVAVAWTVQLLNQAYGFVETPDTPHAMPAYQANLVRIVVEGVVDADLPWTLIAVGVAAALAVELLGVSSLPFAVGLYLPFSLSSPLVVGGLLRWLIGKWRRPAAETPTHGVLASSGLVAGYGLVGVLFAAAVAVIATVWSQPQYQSPLADASEPVVPAHFQPWVAGKIGLDPTYGLGTIATPPDPAPATTQPVTTQPATTQPVDYESLLWFDLLPLAPFLALAVWLAVTAGRRGPPSPPPLREPSSPPKPIPIGFKGPITGDLLPPLRDTRITPPSEAVDDSQPFEPVDDTKVSLPEEPEEPVGDEEQPFGSIPLTGPPPIPPQEPEPEDEIPEPIEPASAMEFEPAAWSEEPAPPGEEPPAEPKQSTGDASSETTEETEPEPDPTPQTEPEPRPGDAAPDATARTTPTLVLEPLPPSEPLPPTEPLPPPEPPTPSEPVTPGEDLLKDLVDRADRTRDPDSDRWSGSVQSPSDLPPIDTLLGDTDETGTREDDENDDRKRSDEPEDNAGPGPFGS